MVSVERSGVGSPRYSCKYRGVDLEITVILLKDSLDFFYYSGAFYEGLFHLRIYDKVYISLAVPEILILESMPLVRQYLKRL